MCSLLPSVVRQSVPLVASCDLSHFVVLILTSGQMTLSADNQSDKYPQSELVVACSLMGGKLMRKGGTAVAMTVKACSAVRTALLRLVS